MTTDLRCPGCGSLVRPEAGWCSLCHEDLRSEEDKAAALRVEEWATVPAAPDQGTDWDAELSALAADPDEGPAVLRGDPGVRGDPGSHEPSAEVPVPVRGRHAKPAQSAPVPLDHSATPTADAPGTAGAGTDLSEVDLVLAKAGIDVRGMLELLAANEPPPLGPLSGRLVTKSQRTIAILVAALALTAAGLLVMFVLGLFVH